MRRRTKDKGPFAADLRASFRRLCNETINSMAVFWGALRSMGGAFSVLEADLKDAILTLAGELGEGTQDLGYYDMLQGLADLSTSDDSGLPVMFSNSFAEKAREMDQDEYVYSEKVKGYTEQLDRYLADVAAKLKELDARFAKKRKKKDFDILAELRDFSDTYTPVAKNMEVLINVLIGDSVKMVRAVQSVSEVMLSLLMNRTGIVPSDCRSAVESEAISELERWKELYTDPKYVLLKYFVLKLLKYLDTKSPKKSVTATVVKALEIDGRVVQENERVEVLGGDETKLDVSIGFDKCSICPEDLRLYLPES